MDLPKINTFLVAAQCLSFTETAALTHSTQSTVSKQIQFLEREWELPLFHRNNGRLSLTPEGEIMSRQLAELPHLLRESLELARQCQQNISGRLQLGCFESLDPQVLMEVMTTRFIKKHPNVQISLDMFSSRDMRRLLEEGRLDIGLMKQFDIETQQGYSILPVGCGEPCLIIGKAHPMGRELMTMEQARNLEFIVADQEESRNTLYQVTKSCQAYGFKPNVVHFVPNIRTLLLYVDAGMGVTIADRNYANNMNHNLRFIPLTKVPPGNNVVTWKTEVTNPIVPLFLEEIRACLGV